MKKLFLLLVTMGVLLTACKSDGDDVGGSNLPEEAYIELSKESIMFAPDGGSIDVTVYSNYEWSISETCNWCEASIMSGEAIKEGTVVTLTADLTYDNREGSITFSCNEEEKVLTVSQSLKEVIIPDENNTFEMPAEGGTIEIAYQTSVECEVVIPEEAKTWIVLAPETKALVSEKVSLTVTENSTYEARNAVVKVVAVGNEEMVVEYTINQKQKDAIIADGDTSFTVPAEGGNIEIAYQTNVECEVSIPEEAQSWIAVAPAARGLASGSTTLYIAENSDSEERSAVVKIAKKNDNTIYAEYTIGQECSNNKGCVLLYTTSDGKVISPSNMNYTSNTYEDGQGKMVFADDAPLTSIGEMKFQSQTTLTSITIPDSVTSIGEYAFYGCTNLENVTIPEGVTDIGKYAFDKCEKLTSVIIPSSVTKINQNVFSNCSSLESVSIPNTITEIGLKAFNLCKALTSVTIPESVTRLRNSAFWECYALQSVYCKATTPPTLGTNMFATNVTGFTIYVPTASVEAYKTASGWSNYNTYIVGYDFE